MNETIKTLLARCSVRAYKPQQITDGELNTILEAGINAATSRNMQSWHLTVIQNKDALAKITAETKATLKRMGDDKSLEKANDASYSPFYNSPTLVIASGSEYKSSRIDCANAIQNMCNAATSLGIGSCYLASFTMAFSDEKAGAELKKLLKIPAGYTPYFATCLGYPAETPAKPARNKNVITFIR